jgi:lipoprotein-anchoring transpeptidase ErfK/SrfK
MSAMRAAVRAVVVVIGMTAAAFTAPTGTGSAAVNQLQDRAIENIVPATGDVVGVAHPVVVAFRSPIANRQAAERSIQIQSKPAMTGKFEWPEDDVVHWVPDRFWPSHSTVALSVGGMRTEFKTGPAVVGVADISEHTFTVTIDGAEPGTSPRLPAPHHRPHRGEEGVLPASMGKEEFPTPVGTYAVMAKDRSVVMDSSSVGVPITDPEGYYLEVDHALRINSRGLYVHSAPWADRVLGVENTSHGCIGLSSTDAEWYFDTVNIGDPVIVR